MPLPDSVKAQFAKWGAQGGKKTQKKKPLTSEQARAMVRARERKKAKK